MELDEFFMLFEDMEEDDDIGYSCDYSGICSGRSCPMYQDCPSKNIVYN